MIGASKLLGLLANDLRRRLLLLLCENESVRVPDAVLERGQTPSDEPPIANGRGQPESRRRTEVRLHHVHLPKLAEADVVEWHRDRDVVARGPNFDDVEPMVTVLAENAPRLPQDVF
ncbi:DUF7344 domain-containing protein [Halosimplex amylolyticum]|uniref:DUF7344 domain-containing protein n=1 Tax=Halosimplex amylolyticum TaxID=3396616 RepID=UPI003F57D09D